jgi:hypothetical protein
VDLGLIYTRHCNAQCTHCATDCGPYTRQTLPLQKVLALMSEAAALTPPGEALNFSLSGGEPFLDLDYLVTVVSHGTQLGGTVSCVTNASWASSDARAAAIVARIRAAGLTRLAASTSRYHQRYVPIARVRRALTLARDAGMMTLLKIAYTVQDEDAGMIGTWSDFVGAEALQTFPVVPYLRNGGTIGGGELVRSAGLPAGRCPAPSLTVREDGRAYTCCTPGAFETLLQAGDVFESGLQDIVDRFHFEPVFQLLREQGPAFIANHASARGGKERLRPAYGDECDLCAHIASDPVLAGYARDCAAEYRRKWAQALVEKVQKSAVFNQSGGSHD